ncbi:MAG: DUF1963 domain-containing protein [Deltaproteobacteria bacterium]|nr:DUF1963 domain-containing protein [Deltaproteobacteria bacterium]
MSILSKARDLVRQAVLPEEIRKLGEDDIGSFAVDEARLLYHDGRRTLFLREEVSPEVLARSLAYNVALKTRSIEHEHRVPLGASKVKGLPHLPPGMKWPAGQYFAAQLRLADFHPHDLEAVFPASGVVYFFFDPGSDCSALYYDGPLDALKITPYPEGLPDVEVYLDEFMAQSARLTFEPGYLFYLGGGGAYDYREIAKRIPADLRASLDGLLGCKLKEWDSGLRIFGRPLYWQGEDEVWPDDEGDGDDSEPEVLLLQSEFGEGHIHFWGAPAKTSRGDFSGVWMSYSGT